MDLGTRIINFLKAIFKALTLSSVVAAPCVSQGAVFDIDVSLCVPRVYDNWQSLGYRKYQTQKITGTVVVDSDCSTMAYLLNRTHKVNGQPVTYSVYVDEALWTAVGSNRTGKYGTPTVMLSLEATPSYVSSYKPTDDDTLVLVLAGKGRFTSSGRIYISGKAAGTLGCGCASYGHVSPTISLTTGDHVDRAAVFGSFTIKERK